MLERWKLSSLLSLSIFFIVVFIVTGMILVNYLVTVQQVKDDTRILQDHTEQVINTSFHLINYGLEIYDNTFNDEMIAGFGSVMDAYNQTHGDISQLDLQALSQSNGGIEIHIINRSAVMVQTSNQERPLLDFNAIYPDFAIFLQNISNTSGFYPDRIVAEYSTGNLTKFAYMPTADHKYIIELALARIDFSNERIRLNYTGIMDQIPKTNPDIGHVRLFRKNFRLVNNSSYNATRQERDIISQILRDRTNLEFEHPDRGEKVRYLLVDMRDERYGADMSLVAEITYHDRVLQERIHFLLIYHFILAGIAIIGGALLSLFISRRIMHPIEELVEDVDRVADGDLDHVIRTGVSVELLILQESVIRLVSNIHDLVQHLREEETKLLQSEERYRNVVETQNELICRFRPDGWCLFVNDAYCRFFHKTREKLIQTRFDPNQTGEEQKTREDYFASLTLEDPVSTIEQQVRGPDGTIRWVQWSNTVIPGEDGKIAEYQSVGREITGRKLLEADLQASETLYRYTINAMVDGVHVIDHSYTILLINTGFAAWTTLPPAKELVQQNLFEVFPFLDEKIRQEYEHVFATGKSMITEEVYDPGNGGVHTETRKIPILFNGRVEKVVTIIRDISDRMQAAAIQQDMNQRLEEEVKTRTQELEAIVQELDSFTYTVSHDLRGPLRAIDGFSHILTLKAEPEQGSDLAYYLSKIHENIRLMDDLIEDLLSFTRMSRKQIERSVIDMERLATDVVGEQVSSYPAAQYDITIDTLPAASADAIMIRQVMVHLISNAMKFSHQQHHPQIRIGSIQNEGTIEYYVQDNGIGFDMQYADKIFDVFQRLHPAGEYEGTGVGLAIVNRIIIRHGGRIRVIAKEGGGATFFFSVGVGHGT
ncbi:MAG: PAS domain S-box protein [Methanospirillum sp.]|uniref:PAS domain S-box protein n=1 Tax=Methanospirillum sp. TaxID=45200 RepID=UPI00236A8287|nr:PAS domain S-box protein [Methanospirillum sp.]MDD1729224.1 PAS domain S-box protein [Methanospirillum sp.]